MEQPAPASAAKRGIHALVVRYAPQPDETVHIDLALVPALHAPAEPIPAVSSSSGHPVLCPPRGPLHYGPGQVFADAQLSYEQAMASFAAASAIPLAERPPDPLAGAAAQRRALRREVGLAQARLRDERRTERTARMAQDAAWREQLAAQRGAVASAGRLPRGRWGSATARAAAWQTARAERRAQQAARTAADAAWREQLRSLAAQATGLALTRDWLAVLVVVDNCSRRSLALPVFASGAHVTAREVVAALRGVLPEELVYLISDRGTHFTAALFAAYLAELGVRQVLTARHRPQSNGIAERFVRTFKAWLADKAWSTAGELEVLLTAFEAEYNERPHQGRGLAGLSPHEYAQRKQAVAFAA